MNDEEKESLSNNNQTSELNLNETKKKIINEKAKTVKTTKRKLEDCLTAKSDCTVRKQPKRIAKENHKITPISYVSQPINDISLALLTIFDEMNIESENSKSHLIEDEIRYAFLAHINKDPASYREALESKDKEHWLKGIEAELPT